MKVLLYAVAVLSILASAGTALAEGGCHGKNQSESAEAPPPPPSEPTT